MNGEDRYDILNRRIEEMLDERRAQEPGPQDPGELEMLKTAAALRGGRPSAPGPMPAFAEALEARLLRERRPAPAEAPSPSRRKLLLGGLTGIAAGLLAGIGLDRAAEQRAPLASPIPPAPDPELVGNSGRWFAICSAGEVPAGSGRRFRKGAIEGFIANRDGQWSACSAVCTHMGCVLTFREEHTDLFCPCHGGQFNTDGSVKRGRSTLKSLPGLRVKEEGGEIYVWCMEELPPATPG
ncbi:MAG: Rieske (2Fe-2S) protein [Chloroflexi bacterium]|nr:Rieske (2Fe-2S) protein [Chloroflexota bacterium]